MMTKPNYYFRILTALTVTAAAAVLAALLVASAPASAQESGPFVMPGSAYPGDQSTRVSRDTYVSVDLSDPMDPTSINTDTFTLVKQGTTIPVEASVTYLEWPYYSEWGGGPNFMYSAFLDPKADLEANATYTATLKGGDIGVKDIYGSSMPKDHSWYFSTGDSITPPPETTINSGPSGPVTSTSASFAFSSSESGSTFQCRLVDSTSDSDWSACSSPKAYTGLSAGSHTFHVKAIGPAGNPDTTPASRTWTVDKTAPTGTVSINNGADRTKTQSVKLTLSATDPPPGSGVSQMRISNTQSGLSSASWEPYSNTRTWTLTSGKGTKTVYVQYRDGAGNPSAIVTDTITYR